MINEIHEIAEHAVPDFLARIKKLSAKSKKLLGKPIIPVMHGVVAREITVNGKQFDADGNRFIATYQRISISAETPKIHGYTFLGTIDHQPKGNLLRSVPGVELPVQYRTAKPLCDHCGFLRQRNSTFILRCDADGSFTQIGRQCLHDFIGYDVSEFLETAKYLSGLVPLESDGEGGYGGGSVSRDISLPIFLAHVHAVIRKYGWTSRADADTRGIASTSSLAMHNMFPLPVHRGLTLPLTDRDRAVALEAIDWVRSVLSMKDNQTTYEYNLTVAASTDYIQSKEIGLAASMISALFRHQEWELKRSERAASLKNSQHIGSIGDRPKDIAVTVYGYHSFETHYGSTHIYRMRTAENSVLIWKASKSQEIAIGDRLLITGTIVEHGSYQEVNQTKMSRCKFVKQPDVATV